MAVASDSEFLSPADAARLIGISAKSVRRLIQEGELQTHRAGRRQYISRSSVQTYLTKDKDSGVPDSSFEAEDDETPDIGELQNTRITYQPQNGNIRFLYDQHKSGELDIAPEFQRFYVFSKRMKDRELILRFFAVFTAQNEYRSPLKTFLSNQMEALNGRSSDYLEDLRGRFLNAVKLANLAFPDHAFQRFAPGDAANPNGVWKRVVNLALFEVVMVSFAKLSYRDIFPKKEEIQERMLRLMTENAEFSDAITINAYRPFKFRRRHEIWSNALSEVLGSGTDDPRFFRKSLRRKLYKQDNTCHICDQEITEFDDATVDHVQPHSKGGRTIPDNARLAHRFCNSSKGARQPQ